jgi:hypothetical protein
MEHRSSAEFAKLGNVIRPQRLSRKQRLMRWALALESRKGTHLATLTEIEHRPRRQRSEARVDGSPLSVAFEDPVLRAAGLVSDRFGDVARFFALSHWQLHELVCHCNHGDSVAPENVALRVRRLANRTTSLVVAITLLMAMIMGTALLAEALRQLSS